MPSTEGRALAEMLIWEQTDRLRRSKATTVIDEGSLL